MQKKKKKCATFSKKKYGEHCPPYNINNSTQEGLAIFNLVMNRTDISNHPNSFVLISLLFNSIKTAEIMIPTPTK